MPTNIVKEFKNPENKSLKDLFFSIVTEDGVKKTICALDKHWAPRSIFSNYTSLVVAGGHYKTGAALEEWLHEAENFKNDLEFLLSLKHHEFWSYMIFQKSAFGCVVSFLQKSIPSYLNIYTKFPNDQVQNLYKNILNLTIDVIFRLLNRDESDEHCLTIEDMREIIYKYITVPMLFHLLLAFGNFTPKNAAILKEIFNLLLNIEPKYKEDLIVALNSYRVTLSYIQTRIYDAVKGGITDNFKTTFDEIVLYTLNCAFILSALLNVCPEIIAMCNEIKLIQSLVNFYKNTLPFMYKVIYIINKSSKKLMWLNLARVQFQQVFDNPYKPLNSKL